MASTSQKTARDRSRVLTESSINPTLDQRQPTTKTHAVSSRGASVANSERDHELPQGTQETAGETPPDYKQMIADLQTVAQELSGWLKEFALLTALELRKNVSLTGMIVKFTGVFVFLAAIAWLAFSTLVGVTVYEFTASAISATASFLACQLVAMVIVNWRIRSAKKHLGFDQLAEHIKELRS